MNTIYNFCWWLPKWDTWLICLITWKGPFPNWLRREHEMWADVTVCTSSYSASDKQKRIISSFVASTQLEQNSKQSKDITTGNNNKVMSW